MTTSIVENQTSKKVALGFAAAGLGVAALAAGAFAPANADAAVINEHIAEFDGHMLSSSTANVDFNNDNTPDKLTIEPLYVQEADYFDGLRISLNGKRIKTIKGADDVEEVDVYLSQTSNGHSSLLFDLEGEDAIHTTVVYTYNNKTGKLKKTLSNRSYIGKYGYNQSINSITAKGKKLYVEYGVMLYATGTSTVTVPYTYKSGKLVAGKTASLKLFSTTKSEKTGKGKAAKAFQTYKNTSAKKKAFMVKKNQTVTMKKVAKKNGKLLVQAVNSAGKKGWFVAPKGYAGTVTGTLFKKFGLAG